MNNWNPSAHHFDRRLSISVLIGLGTAKQ